MGGEGKDRRKDKDTRGKGFWEGWSPTTTIRFKLCQ